MAAVDIQPKTPTHHHASPRRVLGDKSTNTPTRINASRLEIDGLKLKSPRIFLRDDDAVKKGLLTPSNIAAGQKRGIDQITSFEGEKEPHKTNQGKVDTREETQSTEEEVQEQSAVGDAVTRTVVRLPSFNASQEGLPELEQHFNIPEEMQSSQGSTETLKASPFPTHDADPVPELIPSETSHSSGGLSSFVDFGTQDEAHTVVIPRPSTADSPEETADERKAMIQRKAQLLRARLQLAAYKIETDQIHIPFSRLLPPSRRARSPSLPPSVPTHSGPSPSLLRPVENAAARDDGMETPRPGRNSNVPSSVIKGEAANGLLELGRLGR